MERLPGGINKEKSRRNPALFGVCGVNNNKYLPFIIIDT
jgi:hypothetical protein